MWGLLGYGRDNSGGGWGKCGWCCCTRIWWVKPVATTTMLVIVATQQQARLAWLLLIKSEHLENIEQRDKHSAPYLAVGGARQRALCSQLPRTASRYRPPLSAMHSKEKSQHGYRATTPHDAGACRRLRPIKLCSSQAMHLRACQRHRVAYGSCLLT